METNIDPVLDPKRNNKKVTTTMNETADYSSEKTYPDSYFEPVKKTQAHHAIERPSLSYWQDAWIRLKKNKKAILSLYMITGILAFSLLGPFVWTMDPAKQNLNFVSQGPSLGGQALVVDENNLVKENIREDLEATPSEYLDYDELGATSSISIIGTASTVGVSLSWEPVEGASAYNIYRNTHEPTGLSDLGIPLGEKTVANDLAYLDQLQVEPKAYWYSVVATDGMDEAEKYTSLKVEPILAYNLEQAQRIDQNLKAGDSIATEAHPMGTDYLGRDILARLMHGGRVSFFIGLLAPLLYILFGTFYGGISGFVGGRLDAYLMRISDFIVALPFLLFMILFSVAFGGGAGESGIMPMLVAMVALLWPATARLVRGQVLQLREEGFTQAAQMLGATNNYILLRHMIPNTIGVILVTLTFAIPSAIFTEAFLSFIGMGVVPPTASWGLMCNEGIKSMLSTPHELIFPALFISLTVLSFNLLGDGLRDALDSKMRSKE